MLILRASNATFILSFGSGFHLINLKYIERNFGLKVTLNSIHPNKLKSLDRASYESNPLNSRTQSSKAVDVYNLNLDSEREIVYAVTGLSNVPEFGEYISGRDALTMNVETNLPDIAKILSLALDKYKAKIPEEFEWVDNINEVKDLVLQSSLDAQVDEFLDKGDYSSFWLGEPEIVDWEDQIGYSFNLYPRTPRHTTLSLEHYISHLDGDDLNIDSMKNHTVHVNDSAYNSMKKWSVYRCLYGEIDYKGSKYILRNGIWYKIDSNFVNDIDNYLTKLDDYDINLPIYKHDKEFDYNKTASKGNILFMDQKTIQIGGVYDKVEHCDLIKDGKEFIHVKMYRSSSTLSHLFSQGLVSAEAFVGDAEYRHKLNDKLDDSIKLANPDNRPTSSDYSIIYAIATKKNIPIELPFFSKITLKNSLKKLKTLGYNVSLIKINIDEGFLKTKRYPKKKKRA
ncbi:MAG: hypothetical protein ACI9TY_000238 [Alphaproteobacteria bacterium]